jgi:hypothetical protein
MSDLYAALERLTNFGKVRWSEDADDAITFEVGTTVDDIQKRNRRYE